MRAAGGILILAVTGGGLVACGSVSPEPRLTVASAVPSDVDCRDERLGSVSIRVDPAEPGGALIVTDEAGAVLDVAWDPRFRAEVDGERVSVVAPDGRIATSPMTLIGSRVPGGGFLVCDVRGEGRGAGGPQRMPVS